MRLASYNIHIGIGRDGLFDPERIAGVIAEMSADVIALQEVPLGPEPFAMLEFLRHKTGYHALAAPTLVNPVHGEYGNALLSRHEPVSSHCLNLSVPGYQPRCALDADVACGTGGDARTLRIIATHLGLRPGERRQQVLMLLKAITERDADGSRPTVLLGDFNEWFLWGRPLRWLHAHFRETPARATFPSGWPLLALDRMWIHPRSLLSSIRVHRSPLAAVASDHLPLLVDLEMDC
jgi:endonuclease/exonuclease/phosphatase family metal-dependent hydrolase